VRCFVAVDVSAAVRAAVAEAQARLRTAAGRADVRWTDPSQLHITLQFLGAVPDERVPEVAAALAGSCAGIGPLALEVRGLGGFPGARRPRVVWAGVGGDVERVARLAAAVGAALAPLGYPPEARPFHAHLTLGRVRSPRGLGGLARALESAGAAALGAWTATEVVLYQSKLRPTGAVYATVASVPLASI
jgi:2'-5' RNA ligase